MVREQIESLFMSHIKENGGIYNEFGHFKFSASDRIGQGGNGLVYSAAIEKKSVAIKFLITDSRKKHIRFKSEYFNINYIKNSLKNSVNMICYDELKISSELSIPYIIMSQYEKNLKQYRATIDTVNMVEFKSLARFLFESTKSLHDNGILHRDIKPENILIDSAGEYFLSDYGIAHFDGDEFPLANKTSKGERLANIEFSAPEQIDNSFPTTKASDIYSVAQILYWFVFKTVNRGTGGKYISAVFKDEDANIYDDIIYRCINNNPSDRFQSINEIESYYNNKKYEKREIDPFDDMHQFSIAIRSVVPEFYKNASFIEDKDEMEKLFKSIFSKKYNHSIEFNSGNGNNTINSIIRLENNEFLMDYKQMNIIRIWGLLTDDVYDDILLLELGKSQPYIINGKEHYYVAKIENDEIVPINAIESGFVRRNDKVLDIHALHIQERNADFEYKVIVVGPFHSNSILEKNDRFVYELQSNSPIAANDILRLKRNIHMNRALDVELQL